MPQSKSDVHLTPDRVFEIIKEKWGYSKEEMFDPCPENPQWNGLQIDWKKINFVNPPYGKELGEKESLLSRFVDKAIREKLNGNHSIMLLPSKTDQDWFHSLISWNFEIKWIRKRLKFKNDKWSATQPHFLVLIK